MEENIVTADMLHLLCVYRTRNCNRQRRVLQEDPNNLSISPPFMRDIM